MEKFFGVLAFVFLFLFMLSLLTAAVFAILGTPKKNNPVEDKHRRAKKKANIFALVALGCLILGILCVVLNDYLNKKALKEAVDSALFGSGAFITKAYNS